MHNFLSDSLLSNLLERYASLQKEEQKHLAIQMGEHILFRLQTEQNNQRQQQHIIERLEAELQEYKSQNRSLTKQLSELQAKVDTLRESTSSKVVHTVEQRNHIYASFAGIQFVLINSSNWFTPYPRMGHEAQLTQPFWITTTVQPKCSFKEACRRIIRLAKKHQLETIDCFNGVSYNQYKSSNSFRLPTEAEWACASQLHSLHTEYEWTCDGFSSRDGKKCRLKDPTPTHPNHIVARTIDSRISVQKDSDIVLPYRLVRRVKTNSYDTLFQKEIPNLTR